MNEIEPTVDRPLLPLSALLSQVLIAFTLEFDHTFAMERTADGTRVFPPSLAMWANLLRFVGDDGIDKNLLPALSGVSVGTTHFMLATLERHGWVAVANAPTDRKMTLISLTEKSRPLQEMWRPNLAKIEQRWQTQFGEEAVRDLRSSLEAIVHKLQPGLPHYPMVRLNTSRKSELFAQPLSSDVDADPNLPLPALLSQVLIAFSLAYESEIEDGPSFYPSLALYANVLRLLSDDDVALTQISSLSGISRPATNILVNVLVRDGSLVIDQDQAGNRGKMGSLTARGRQLLDTCQQALPAVEQHWKEQFGEDSMVEIQNSLEAVVRQFDVPLPHYPMAIPHRGGTPTGL